LGEQTPFTAKDPERRGVQVWYNANVKKSRKGFYEESEQEAVCQSIGQRLVWRFMLRC
jgi:hypothetical protein